MRCKNCDNTVNEEFNFCPECGQKVNDVLTIRVLFSNTISNYFSVDARFFKSFLPLILKPGYLARTFVDGKRLVYLHPAQFYLFISVIFFFFFSFTARQHQLKSDSSLKKGFEKGIVVDSLDLSALDSIKNYDDGLSIKYEFDKEKLDSLIAFNATEEEKLMAMGLEEGDNRFVRFVYSQMLKIYIRRGGGVLEAFYRTIPISLFFLLPLFAFFLKLLFYRTSQFSHNLVFSFYFFTYLFTVFSIILIANFFIVIPGWMHWLIVFVAILYLLLSVMRFYNKKYFVATFKTVVLLLSYTIIVIPVSIVVMGFISVLLY